MLFVQLRFLTPIAMRLYFQQRLTRKCHRYDLHKWQWHNNEPTGQNRQAVA
jgi:hypothetical protein